MVSRCLGFEPVRYNGQIISDPFVQRLAEHCEPVVVCPEVEIGLGVPRPPIRLVRSAGSRPALVQPETGRDVTGPMAEFSARFLSALPAVDGFVLKSRSPSCGFRDAKVFADRAGPGPVDRGAGAFAAEVAARFPTAALEDEGGLGDAALRERFLTLLFALARLRAIEAAGERAALVEFHARYRYVLLAHEERRMREMERLAAGIADLPWHEGVARYRERFARALARPARVDGHVSALQHAFGPAGEGLASGERAFLRERIEEMREGEAPPTAALARLREWALRLGNLCLEARGYLEPYPRALAG